MLIKPGRKSLKKTAELASEYIGDSKGLILFFDEARFGLQPDIARQWSLKGKRSVAPVKTGYKNFYLYAAVDPIEGESFILELPRVDTDMVNLFFQELHDAFPDRKILFIWDQAGYHRAKDLQIPSNIKIEYLPPYSPELNPPERLWRWLRRHACRNRLFNSIDEQAEILGNAIRSLTKKDFSLLCSCSYLMQEN